MSVMLGRGVKRPAAGNDCELEPGVASYGIGLSGRLSGRKLVSLPPDVSGWEPGRRTDLDAGRSDGIGLSGRDTARPEGGAALGSGEGGRGDCRLLAISAARDAIARQACPELRPPAFSAPGSLGRTERWLGSLPGRSERDAGSPLGLTDR
jgi:hypothetical protein